MIAMLAKLGPLALRFWWAIPILGLAVALMLTRATLASTKATLAAEQSAHRETVERVKRATAEAKAADAANVVKVERQQKEITDAISSDYQQRLVALRNRYDRMRVAAEADRGGGGVARLPQISVAAGGSDDSACPPRLPLDDALTASETALRLDALQRWNRAQAAVEPTSEP